MWQDHSRRLRTLNLDPWSERYPGLRVSHDHFTTASFSLGSSWMPQILLIIVSLGTCSSSMFLISAHHIPFRPVAKVISWVMTLSTQSPGTKPSRVQPPPSLQLRYRLHLSSQLTGQPLILSSASGLPCHKFPLKCKPDRATPLLI